MAPPPEYDKEPKAPDKSGSNISCEEKKALHNIVNEQQNNTDSKTANVTANSEVENKHVEALDDSQLRALLDEAITYKCPKDREGKSSLFKELLGKVEQAEQAARNLNVAVGRRQRNSRDGRGARHSVAQSNSLQDLVAALAAEPAPRRHHRHHNAPPATTVSARAYHGGSLPSGVDTSFLLGEEPSTPRGANYLATVRCVNPPPLSERRVSASDAPHDDNRRSKPAFPMTYTARATLEIGSGGVSAGRATTTTTASNQVRTTGSTQPSLLMPTHASNHHTPTNLCNKSKAQRKQKQLTNMSLKPIIKTTQQAGKQIQSNDSKMKLTQEQTGKKKPNTSKPMTLFSLESNPVTKVKLADKIQSNGSKSKTWKPLWMIQEQKRQRDIYAAGFWGDYQRPPRMGPPERVYKDSCMRRNTRLYYPKTSYHQSHPIYYDKQYAKGTNEDDDGDIVTKMIATAHHLSESNTETDEMASPRNEIGTEKMRDNKKAKPDMDKDQDPKDPQYKLLLGLCPKTVGTMDGGGGNTKKNNKLTQRSVKILKNEESTKQIKIKKKCNEFLASIIKQQTETAPSENVINNPESTKPKASKVANESEAKRNPQANKSVHWANNADISYPDETNDGEWEGDVDKWYDTLDYFEDSFTSFKGGAHNNSFPQTFNDTNVTDEEFSDTNNYVKTNTYDFPLEPIHDWSQLYSSQKINNVEVPNKHTSFTNKKNTKTKFQKSHTVKSPYYQENAEPYHWNENYENCESPFHPDTWVRSNYPNSFVRRIAEDSYENQCKYRELLRDALVKPDSSNWNPRNVRKMTIGKPLSQYEDFDVTSLQNKDVTNTDNTVHDKVASHIEDDIEPAGYHSKIFEFLAESFKEQFKVDKGDNIVNATRFDDLNDSMHSVTNKLSLKDKTIHNSEALQTLKTEAATEAMGRENEDNVLDNNNVKPQVEHIPNKTETNDTENVINNNDSVNLEDNLTEVHEEMIPINIMNRATVILTTPVATDIPTESDTVDVPTKCEATDIPTKFEATDFPTKCETTVVPNKYEATLILTTSVDTDVPRKCEATDVPMTSVATDVPAKCEPTEIPTKCEAIVIPCTSVHTDVLVKCQTTEVPTKSEATEIPTMFVDIDFPNKCEATNVPTKCEATVIPTTSVATDVPTKSEVTKLEAIKCEAENVPTKSGESDIRNGTVDSKTFDSPSPNVVQGNCDSVTFLDMSTIDKIASCFVENVTEPVAMPNTKQESVNTGAIVADISEANANETGIESVDTSANQEIDCKEMEIVDVQTKASDEGIKFSEYNAIQQKLVEFLVFSNVVNKDNSDSVLGCEVEEVHNCDDLEENLCLQNETKTVEDVVNNNYDVVDATSLHCDSEMKTYYYDSETKTYYLVNSDMCVPKQYETDKHPQYGSEELGKSNAVILMKPDCDEQTQDLGLQALESLDSQTNTYIILNPPINLTNVDNSMLVVESNSQASSQKVRPNKKTKESNRKKNEAIDRNNLRNMLISKLFHDSAEQLASKLEEVDSAIPFSCITTPEVVASCNITSSTQSAAAVDTKPRSVISSNFNGLPLSRPNYGSMSTTEEYKKPLDENGNSVQGFSSPLSGSSQHKKPRRKKSSKNETVIKSHQIDGYQGNKDLNEVLRFIESNADPPRSNGPKLRKARHEDEDKPKKRERRKDKTQPPQRAASLEEIAVSSLRELTTSRPPPAKPERRSWGDDFRGEDEPGEFQTVTKKRRWRRRELALGETAGGRGAGVPPPAPRPRRVSAPPSDRSDSNDDDSVHSLHSLPALNAGEPGRATASYAEIARAANIPDLIESCNFYAEEARDTGPPPAEYPALEPRRRPPPPKAPQQITTKKERKERVESAQSPPSSEPVAPDVVGRPAVILLDSARHQDIAGITFGFDINEQLLADGSRRGRCDLVLTAQPPPACPPRYVPPPHDSSSPQLHHIVQYVALAWEDVIRCSSGKVHYYSE